MDLVPCPLRLGGQSPAPRDSRPWGEGSPAESSGGARGEDARRAALLDGTHCQITLRGRRSRADAAFASPRAAASAVPSARYDGRRRLVLGACRPQPPRILRGLRADQGRERLAPTSRAATAWLRSELLGNHSLASLRSSHREPVGRPPDRRCEAMTRTRPATPHDAGRGGTAEPSPHSAAYWAERRSGSALPGSVGGEPSFAEVREQVELVPGPVHDEGGRAQAGPQLTGFRTSLEEQGATRIRDALK